MISPEVHESIATLLKTVPLHLHSNRRRLADYLANLVIPNTSPKPGYIYAFKIESQPTSSTPGPITPPKYALIDRRAGQIHVHSLVNILREESSDGDDFWASPRPRKQTVRIKIGRSVDATLGWGSGCPNASTSPTTSTAMVMMASSRLLSLPPELLATIAAIVPVDSIVAFALTCSHLHQLVRFRLEANRRQHELYRLQHDRSPLGVPTLLRLAMEDPEAIWHLRAFDSWGIRPGWDKWKTWELGDPDDDEEWPDPVEDHSSLTNDYFSSSELARFRGIMAKVLYMPEDMIQVWATKIEEGWDEPLKGMIFALAPHLNRLNFVAYDTNYGAGGDFHDEDPLKFLCEAITSIHTALAQNNVWPPGLSSLRTISICTSTDLRHPHEAYYTSPARVAPLFLLPNLETLNLTLLGYNDGPIIDSTSGLFLPPASSSITSLALSSCSIGSTVVQAFISAPRRLLHFLSASSTPDSRYNISIIHHLSSVHGAHLQSLSLEPQFPYFPHLPPLFPALLSLDFLSASHIKRSTLEYTFKAQNPGLQETQMPPLFYRKAHLDLSYSTEDKVAAYNTEIASLHSLLPPRLERISLLPARERDKARNKMLHRTILQDIVELVEGDTHPALKEICLAELLVGTMADVERELVRRIEAQGVDLHLRYMPQGPREGRRRRRSGSIY
ncbi:hypothetical protein KVT40_003451 [Elsinoe batatas]|uniref:F-box domain-containing protein n=1 Tax=Elsinoe batatas TaxID=2601811 RepID=A0A8K0L8A1_9PEZI|nr:hypothetical protein KVT40_003451 [Elsinoe batatas]